MNAEPPTFDMLSLPLVYTDVTLPAGDDTSAYVFFLDDKTDLEAGRVLSKVNS